MRLSRSERIFFVAIIISITMGMLLLVLSTMFSAPNIIRQAWAPNTVRVVREAVMGEPSTTVTEAQKIVRIREDVPLPETNAMFDAGFRAEPDGFSFRNYGTRFPEGDLTP